MHAYDHLDRGALQEDVQRLPERVKLQDLHVIDDVLVVQTLQKDRDNGLQVAIPIRRQPRNKHTV